MDSSKISGLYFGLIFASIAIVGISIFQADLMAHYGTSNKDFGYLNKSREITAQVGNLTTAFNTSITGIAPLDALINTVFSSTKLFFGIYDLYASFASGLNEVLKIPIEIINLIMVAILAIIIFSVFSIITDRRV